MTIQAVFWDYDNTILATEEEHWHKHKAVLARHGIELSELFRKRIYENNGNQNWAWLKNELGLNVPEEEYLKEIDAEFQKRISNLELRPGVAELFELIKLQGIPQAIVTNARRDSAKPVLDEKGITPLMKFILFKEDYEGRKPDPAPYLRGFEIMGTILGEPIDPKRCLVIEDDPKGVESACKAGAIVIHRKLKADDTPSSLTKHCCYDKEAFISLVKKLILT